MSTALRVPMRVPREGSSSGAPDDPNEIVIVFSWTGMDKAREFASSEDLKKVMEQAGIADKPDVFFLDEAAKLTM